MVKSPFRKKCNLSCVEISVLFQTLPANRKIGSVALDLETCKIISLNRLRYKVQQRYVVAYSFTVRKVVLSVDLLYMTVVYKVVA